MHRQHDVLELGVVPDSLDRLIGQDFPERLQRDREPVRRLHEGRPRSELPVGQRDVAVRGEVELGEDDLVPFGEIQAGEHGRQRQRDVDGDGELVGVASDQGREGRLDRSHPGEDVLHPDEVGGALFRPCVDVVLEVALGPARYRPERRADQIGLLPDDGELVAVGLERVSHPPRPSRA